MRVKTSALVSDVGTYVGNCYNEERVRFTLLLMFENFVVAVVVVVLTYQQ